jgi:hypothetical protein
MAKRSAKAKPRPKKSAPKSTSAAVPTAISLHIGLNGVDPAAYDGWSGPLGACEADADSMIAIAASKKMTSTKLLTKQATRSAVLAGLRSASKSLRAGDFFFLTYSGHGGQVEDISGDEADKLDETWCLFDGQLIDDELFLELSKFAKGVRVLVLSDSCHSGTITRERPAPPPPGARMMPSDVARRVYEKHKAFYDGLQKDVMKATRGNSPDAALARVTVTNRLTRIAGTCNASVLLISGCQDNQTSMDGVKNGAFTEQFLKVWNDGKYKGNYGRFHATVLARMPHTQSPNLFELGPTSFANEQVFKI